ncbi:lipopolysaccharide biosynthesis protein [Solibacillus sp. NPDC093137]|uniref:lipopolysaccharide biosynthesis protein n=1 Tax=Solibacillus sp. NPDC093137 TaxID=3390678 RepID=UPI003D05BC24
MKNYLDKLKSNRFISNFIKLFSATLFSQVIIIAISPLLTRLYSPEDFGMYSLYIAVVTLIIVYSTWRYEIAIASTKDLKVSEEIFKLVIVISIISSIVVAITILIGREELNNLFGLSKSNLILFFIPITVMGMAVMNAFNYYYNRQQEFSHLSKSKVIQSVTTSFTSVGFGFVGLNSIGMIIANVFGIFSVVLYNTLFKNSKKLFFIREYNFSKLKEIAIKYKEYPLYNTHSAFIDVIAIQAPVIIFTRFFSEVITGLYALTVRVITLPLSIISVAVSQVYLSEMVEKENRGEDLYPSIKKTFRLLSIIGILPTIIIILFAPTLFNIFFGEKWLEAGKLAQIMAMAYYAKFIISPLSMIFIVKNAIKLLSKIQFLRAILTISILIISVLIFNDIYITLFIFMLYEVLVYICLGYFIFKISKERSEIS